MLDQILAHKRALLKKTDTAAEIVKIKSVISSLPPTKSLRAAVLSGEPPALIAEIKRRSPSKGLLQSEIDIASTVHAYERGGAEAISIVTESDFFDGCIEDLLIARTHTSLPILRKDFIVSEFQIWESRYIGTDAVLLIAAILNDSELSKLYDLCRLLKLEAIMEVHDERDLERALAVSPQVIGINNRDLKSFTVDLGTSERLAPLIPEGIVRISESGIKSREDLVRLGNFGINAVLVGECLVTSRAPDKEVQLLLGKAS